MTTFSDIIISADTAPWLPSPNTVTVRPGIPPQLPTAVFVLAFYKSTRLLCSNVLSRGIDLVGGHVEPGETALEAIIRETMEETGATLSGIIPLAYREIHVPNPPANYRHGEYSYHAFYAAHVATIGERSLPAECGLPFLLGRSDIAKTPRISRFDALIEHARNALNIQ